jgi:gluconate 2-dehydrogenase gamma chain
MKKIDRREAIRRTAWIMGGTLTSTLVTAVLSGCQNHRSENGETEILSAKQLETAADVAEVILPTTNTPGAKEAGTGFFIDKMIADWMKPDERELALSGLDRLEQNGFLSLSFEEQTQAIHRLLEDNEGRAFFRLFKQVTLLGFFTSEVGATQVLQYDEIPGMYSGCEDLEYEGGKTWAT